MAKPKPRSIKTSVNRRSTMQKKKPVIEPKGVQAARQAARARIGIPPGAVGRGRGRGGRGGGGRGGGRGPAVPAGYARWAIAQGIIGGDY